MTKQQADFLIVPFLEDFGLSIERFRAKISKFGQNSLFFVLVLIENQHRFLGCFDDVPQGLHLAVTDFVPFVLGIVDGSA